MGLCLNDDDARHLFVRMCFNREMGREPESPAVHDTWAAGVAFHGADLVLAQIRDSPEAAAFRAKRGW